MDVQALMSMAADKFPWVLMIFSILGMLVVLGTVVVKLTPSQKDDEFLAKLEAYPVLGAILKYLVAFSPIQKK